MNAVLPALPKKRSTKIIALVGNIAIPLWNTVCLLFITVFRAWNEEFVIRKIMPAKFPRSFLDGTWICARILTVGQYWYCCGLNSRAHMSRAENERQERVHKPLQDARELIRPISGASEERQRYHQIMLWTQSGNYIRLPHTPGLPREMNGRGNRYIA